jgi:hypothetical protein
LETAQGLQSKRRAEVLGGNNMQGMFGFGIELPRAVKFRDPIVEDQPACPSKPIRLYLPEVNHLRFL